MSTEPRTYEIERDRFALMYSGPGVRVGEMRKVYEASEVDVERKQMLDLIETLLSSLLGWHQVPTCLMTPDELRAFNLLRQHGRLTGEDDNQRSALAGAKGEQGEA